MLKVSLTHDVDRVAKHYQYITYLLKSVRKIEIEKFLYHLNSFFKPNPYWNFEKIIRIEEDFRVKSTFFFLNESIKFELSNIKNWKLSLGRYNIESKAVREIIQWLDENGWEIGVHGSYNSYKLPGLLLKEKNTLEEILGHEVIGTRQHYLNLNDLTWGIQKEMGFRYDASWGNTESIGFKEDKYAPFHPFKDAFVVFPLQIMDSCFMNTENRWTKLLNIMDLVEKNDGLLVLNWHQRVFNEKEFPQFATGYSTIIKELNSRGAKFYLLSEYCKELEDCNEAG